MEKIKLPEFKSLGEEREFWDTHDVFEVLGEEYWKVAEAGTIRVQSIYVTRVADNGLFIYVPKELLGEIGVKEDGKIKMWVDGKRLVVEAA